MLDALPISLLVIGIYSGRNTTPYVFLLQILDCSKKITAVLVVLSIVPSTMLRTALCLHPYCTASIKIILDFGALGLQVKLARRISQPFVVSCSLLSELQVCPYRLTGTLFKREHLACLLNVVFYHRHRTIPNLSLMWRSSSRAFFLPEMSKRRLNLEAESVILVCLI
jgi:hypothetical protein